MNSILTVLAMMAGAACFIKPRGLLVPRRTRQRWRSHRKRGKSGRVSARLRRRVLAADRNRCVACGATAKSSGHPLQIDHGIPWIMGGLTWFPNLFTLCKPCNGTKGIYWVSPAGTVYYHATWGKSDRARAAAIRQMEVRARRSVPRLARAG